MENYVGKRLDGRYEIIEIIGVGGMAVVYKAFDNIDKRIVAVKILKDEYLSSEEFRRRFRNESKAIAVLSHPNIVKVYDVSYGDRLQYIVMEHVEGITLKEYIQQQGRVDIRESIYFVTQILRALQHAHDKGIVHRDIKPQNIMLISDGTIKVTDFGIARFSRSETKTMTETAIGSVHYISPEQAKGSVVDAKTDIYSVGVVLYELLTGKLPFQSDNAVSVALMQLQNDPVRPRTLNPDIPIGLEQIIMRAMQKNPNDRYQSASEMLVDIDAYKKNPNIKFDYSYFVDKSPTKYLPNRQEISEEMARNRAAQTSAQQRPVVRPYTPQQTQQRQVQRPVQRPATRPAQRPVRPVRQTMSSKERAAKRRTIAVLSGILAAVAIVAGIVIWMVMESMGIEKAPNLVGKNWNEVSSSSDYHLDMEFDYNSGRAPGEIVRQSPSAGSRIQRGGTIKVWVARDDDNVPVPDVYGLDINTAQTQLKADGFIPIIENVPSAKVARGHVIKTIPEKDAKVKKGSSVTVYVSLGETEEEVSVPDLIGDSVNEAQEKLEAVGLKMKAVYRENSAERGTVFGYEYRDESVAQGTTIEVYISEGPERTTEPTTEEKTTEATTEEPTTEAPTTEATTEEPTTTTAPPATTTTAPPPTTTTAPPTTWGDDPVLN